MPVQFLPTKKIPEDRDKKMESAESTNNNGAKIKSRHRLSREEKGNLKVVFRQQYEEGKPPNEIGKRLGLSAGQINKIQAELFTDSDNPLTPRPPAYLFLEVRASFRNIFPDGFLPSDWKYLRVELERDGLTIIPVNIN